MNPCELVSFVTAVSCAIARCVPKEELPVVIAILGQTATTLTTILAQEELLNPSAAVPLPEVTPETELIATPPGAATP